MSYQQQPLTNGLPPSAMPQSQSFSKYMPPGHQAMGSIPQQYQPPPPTNYVPSSSASVMTGTKFPIQPAAGPPTIPSQQQQHQQQNLLVNGGSNHSSRTASPALNQTLNTTHLPPTSNFHGRGGVGSDMAQTLKSSQNQSNLMTGTMAGSMTDVTSQQNQQNMSKLTGSMQNISLANGPVTSVAPAPPPNTFSSAGPLRPTAVNGMQTSSAPTIPPNQLNGPTNQTRSTQGSFDAHQHLNQLKMYAQSGQNQMPQPTGQHQMPLPLGQNQMPLPSVQHQMHPTMGQSQMMPPPPMQNQMPPLATPQPLPNQFKLPPSSQQQQYSAGQQYSANSTPLPPTSTTLNKRPMYPPTQQQQQQHQMHPQPVQQQQQQPQYGNSNYQQNQMYNGQSGVAPNQMNYPGSGQPGASGKMNVVQQGFNKFWGQDTIDLMQQRHVLPATRVKPPTISLGHEFYDSVNCSPE